MLKDVLNFTDNFYPLNLISLLKSKISLSTFTLSTSILKLIFKKVNAEVPFTPSSLEICI